MKCRHLVFPVLFALTTTVFAEGFYGVGEVTHSGTSLDRSHFDTLLANNGAAARSRSGNGNGTQWRFQGGYSFNPYFALEVGYIDFGKTKYTASYAGGSATGSLKAGGVDVAAFFTLPLNDSFSVFAKAG